ncbi:MAG: hypothetical protein U9P71_01090 [Campylobacterota bacterium]|nr:hypothetical protein [Campylobacterota bacterium]
MKSMLINRFNGKNHTVYLPCDEIQAATFAGAMLDGEYQVLKMGAVSGTEAETVANKVNIMVKNTTSGEKAYFNMLVDSSKSEEEIFAVVIGLTINGVLVDEAYIMSMTEVLYA